MIRRRWPVVAASLLGGLLLAALLQGAGAGGWLERRSLELRFRLRSAPVDPPPVTVVVLRGDRIQRDERPLRQHLADLLELLASLPANRRPRAAVVDIRLAMPDPPAVGGELSDTQRLIRDTAKLSQVVHAFELAFDFREYQSPEAQRQLQRQAVRARVPISWPPTAVGARAAHPSFGPALFQAAGAAGFTNVSAGEWDGDPVITSLPLVARVLPAGANERAGDESLYPSLALAGVLQALRASSTGGTCDPAGRHLTPELLLSQLPLDADGQFWINHRPRFGFDLFGATGEEDLNGADHEPVTDARPPDVMQFHTCAETEASADPAETSPCSRSRGFFSRTDGTPIPSQVLEGWLPCQVLLIVDGHEQSVVRGPFGPRFSQATLHAQVMSNLLEQDFLQRVPAWSGWLAGLGLLVAAVLVRLAGGPVSPPSRALMRFGRWAPVALVVRETLWVPETGLAAAWVLTAGVAFDRWSLWLPIVAPLSMLAGGQAGWRWMNARQLRRDLQRVSELVEVHQQTIETLDARRGALEAELDQQLQHRLAMEEALVQANGEAEEARQALEDANQWVRAAEAGRQQLGERLEDTLARATAAERLAAKLQDELQDAVEPGEVERLQQAWSTARDRVEALHREVTALRRAGDEARALAELAAVQARGAEEARSEAERRAAEAERALAELASMPAEQLEMLQGLEQTLEQAMRLSGRVTKPVQRLSQVLAAGGETRDALIGRLARSGKELEAEMQRLKQQERRLEAEDATVAALRSHLAARQEVYRAVMQHVQSVMLEAGQCLERLAPPGDGGEATANGGAGPEAIRRKTTGEFLTTDPDLVRLLDKDLPRFASSDLPVLILGETGTGKEVIAQLLHAKGGNRGKFVAINCAAFPEGLIESELFGYVKGAFTGAVRDHRGLIEEANGGMLLLDEIGRLPTHLQGRLLRVLQERTVRRLGSNAEIPVQFRLLAATSASLEAGVNDKSFLIDLYYRLKGLTIQLPPLRDRRGDISFLARRFLSLEAARTGRDLRWTPEALAALNAWTWPGNVRELENFVKALVVMANGDEIDAALVWSRLDVTRTSSEKLEDFTAEELARLAVMRRCEFVAKRCAEDGAYQGSKATADRHIRVFICKALYLRDWDVHQAAALLAGSGRSSLALVIQRRIRRFLGENLRQHLERAMADREGVQDADWDAALKEQYKAEYPLVRAVVEALREGRIKNLDVLDAGSAPQDRELAVG